MTNDNSNNQTGEYSRGRGGRDDRLPDGTVRPLTAREREMQARRAAIREVSIEQADPRRQ